jgi:hypothetical protein
MKEEAMDGGTNRWFGIASAVLLALGGCSGNGAQGKEKSMVRGMTPLPSILVFACDDGETYEVHSHPFGNSRSRFSLTLPRDRICRLWIKSEGKPLHSVLFYDYRGNLSSLIYLKSPRVDLGKIGVRRGELVAVNNDDLLLVANDEETAQAVTPARTLYFGKAVREARRFGSGS